MGLAVYVVIALMLATCGLLSYGAKAFERRWNRMHPPEDYDGCRVDKQRGDN